MPLFLYVSLFELSPHPLPFSFSLSCSCCSCPFPLSSETLPANECHKALGPNTIRRPSQAHPTHLPPTLIHTHTVTEGPALPHTICQTWWQKHSLHIGLWRFYSQWQTHPDTKSLPKLTHTWYTGLAWFLFKTHSFSCNYVHMVAPYTHKHLHNCTVMNSQLYVYAHIVCIHMSKFTHKH